MDTATSNEATIVHQGIIASSLRPEAPNEHLQSVIILPYTSDGSVYKGFLTYTATKPVELTLQQRIPIDNTTLSQLDMQKYGELFVRHLAAFPGEYLLHQGLILIIEEAHHHIFLHLFLL